MPLKILVFLIMFLPLLSFSQETIRNQIDQLQYVVEMPYICEGNFDDREATSTACGDPRFWQVVKLKENAIPYLLEKLNDATPTKASVPNFGYAYSVADIAYVALEEIIHGVPTFELLGVEFDKEGCGYCAYWEHLNRGEAKREQFKTAVQNWYTSHQDNLVWIENDYFSSCDCHGTHPNGGHFELSK